jgi:hypothetical protein
MGQDWGVPILACPQCRIRQYAQVSYVVSVCCVACGCQLEPATALSPRPPLQSPGAERRVERSAYSTHKGAR